MANGDAGKASRTGKKGDAQEATKPDEHTPPVAAADGDRMLVVRDEGRSKREDMVVDEQQDNKEDDDEDDDDEEMGEEELHSLTAAAFYLYANEPQLSVSNGKANFNVNFNNNDNNNNKNNSSSCEGIWDNVASSLSRALCFVYERGAS